MSHDDRWLPWHLNPLDDAGATVADGTYGEKVVGGKVTGLTPVHPVPAGGDEGETLAKLSSTDYDAVFIPGSVPTISLPAGSTAVDVPAGTPYGSIILVKA